ncbi:AraC family transcriptional regulator [Marinilongibacter aquaticus]|uniref:helix-turn-helix domain-containing protein n=1 Tax=Marinilongibacter aquaticus TaxID=2975157 RepID=UPI0021BDE7A8|nr:AraC family transcriptional regulator [Marinilongibacter aquaticus]UBM59193.1 AraC family transcriptional regulator [Marinilongibacter aquaticus]
MHHRVLKHSFSLLNVDNVSLDKRWNFKNVVSPYHRIYLICKGEGEISNTEKSIKLEAGHLYFIPAYTLCNLYCSYSLDQYFVQFFETSPDGSSLYPNYNSVIKIKAEERDLHNFERLVEINPDRGINRSDNPSVYEKEIYFKEYQELNDKQSLPVFLETQGLLLQMMSRFAVPELFHKKEPISIPHTVTETIRHIVTNLHLPLSVNALAKRSNLNEVYFSRLFEKHTGIRPLAFIHEKRIERARNLMQTSTASYSEIAERTGFRNLAHFSRTFKKITGLSPRAYSRKTYGL